MLTSPPSSPTQAPSTSRTPRLETAASARIASVGARPSRERERSRPGRGRPTATHGYRGPPTHSTHRVHARITAVSSRAVTERSRRRRRRDCGRRYRAASACGPGALRVRAARRARSTACLASTPTPRSRRLGHQRRSARSTDPGTPGRPLVSDVDANHRHVAFNGNNVSLHREPLAGVIQPDALIASWPTSDGSYGDGR